jgi:hypothetical protein
VLLGHAGIHDHLAAPLLDSLRQRVRLRAELEPFTEAELQDYLRHQIARAGGHFDQIFAPGTVAALHRYSNGIARLVNTLCESALDVAAVQHHKQLTSDLVARTAVSLLGLAERIPAARLVTSAPPVSAPPAETRLVSRAAPASATPAIIVERRPEPRVTAVPTPPPTRAEAPPAPPPARAEAPPAPPPPAAPPPATPPLQASASPVPGPSPKSVELEYDGGATDVADVAIADFPILTDAVEPPAAKPIAAATGKTTTPAPPAATIPPQQSRPAAAAAPSAAPATGTTAPKSGSRVETAYASTRPAAKPEPAPAAPATPPAMTPLPHVAAAAKPKAPAGAPSPSDPQADDELRQTQTMRAIAGAKSIDDLSEFDAETLFSDAELDLVSAALASAADWPDDEEPAAAAPSRPEAQKAKPVPARPAAPEPAKPAAPRVAAAATLAEDDPFDLFGLGDDAPLELIDDSKPPSNDRARKTAAR